MGQLSITKRILLRDVGKLDTYRVAWDRMIDSMASRFYLESVTIQESIIPSIDGGF